jgi:hypothetical protein
MQEMNYSETFLNDDGRRIRLRMLLNLYFNR